MKDFDMYLVLMLLYFNSWLVCVLIQGYVVNLVLLSDLDFDLYYDLIFNYGYGELFGI